MGYIMIVIENSGLTFAQFYRTLCMIDLLEMVA